MKKRPRALFVRYLLLVTGLFTTMLPMVYMISASLRPNKMAFRYPPRLLPKLSEITLDNYRYVLSNQQFFRYLFNTIIVATATVLLSVIIASALAFCLARFRFIGRRLLSGAVIAVMLIPGLALLIPQFELAVSFNLVDSLWGVILFYTAWVTPFSTFLLKGYIEDNIPIELDEATYADGGTVFTVYRYVILPLASPAIAAISILNFLFPFEELGWSQAILKSDQLRTLPVALTMFFQAHNRTDWGFVFAMTCMAMVPVIVIYVALQRYFIKGLSAGAIK